MDPSRPVPTLPPHPGATTPGTTTAPVTGAPAVPDPWSPPDSAPPVPLPMQFEPVAPPPRRRRGLLFTLVAIVAVIATGIGAAFALRGDGGAESVVAVDGAPQYSLAAAAQQAAEASTVRFEMTMSMGDLGEMSMTGGIDRDAQVMHMTVSIDSMFGAGFGSEAFEAIIDAGSATMYMKAPAEMGFPIDSEWISMDLAMIADESGMSLEDFQDQMTADPLEVANLFTDLGGEFTDLGIETVDGEQLRHYVVTVDFADVIAANPQLEQQLGELGDDVPDSIEYDVWVTEDNQLRRMDFSIEVAGQDVDVQMKVFEVDEPLAVVLPDPSEVTDLSDWMGGF